jgi:hypothetical protein
MAAEGTRERRDSNKYSLKNLSFTNLYGNKSLSTKDPEQPTVRLASSSVSGTTGRSTLGKSAIKGMGFKVGKAVKIDTGSVKKTSVYDLKWGLPVCFVGVSPF